MNLLGSQRRTGLLGTAATVVLLAMTLGLAGCGSSSSDAEAPTDEGSRFVELTFSIDGYPTPFVPIPDRVSLAGAHQLPIPAFTSSRIDRVRVIDGRVPTTPSGGQTVDVELTLAKWLPAERTWINLLQRDRQTGDGPVVIRAGNLRLQGENAVSGGMNGQFTTIIRSPDADFGGPGPVDFGEGAVWRRDGNDQAAHYCGDDAAYCDYVQGILDDIKAAGRWDDNAIYRVGVTSRSPDVSRFNAIGYFRGNGVLVDNPNPAMSTASCAGCHGESVLLNVHGNQRFEPELCTSCHNPFTFDRSESIGEPDGWVNIDTTLMIHKIHAGIDDYRVDGKDYSEVRYPDWLFGRNAGPKNCTTCHEDERPVEVAHWNSFPSTRACLSCHEGDTVLQAFPAAPPVPAHTAPVSQLDPMVCAGCHAPDSSTQARTADQFHGVTAALGVLEQRNDYRLKIVSVTDAVAGAAPRVEWQVVDGDGIPRSVSALNPQRFLVGIGWGHGDDWVNDGVDPGALTPARTTGARGDPWRVEVTGDNTVFAGDSATTTLPALPAAATAGRNGYAAIYMVEDDSAGLNVNGSLVKPNTAIATLTLGTNAMNPGNNRREIVSAEACNSCHTTTFRHGTYADDDIMGCVACHNAGSLSRDASVVQGSVDFMFMVHAIHGIGDGKRVRFDRRRDHGYLDRSQVNTVLDCQSCHLPGTYDFPVDRNARIGVIADGAKGAFLAGTGGVNSAEPSVCFSCHESGVDPDADLAKAHMVVFGATMDGGGTHAGLLGEVSACTGCHTPTK